MSSPTLTRPSSRAVRSLSLLTLSSFGAAGLAFLTQWVLARNLPPADYGALATAIATVNLLAPLAGFGIGTYWLRAFGAEGWGAQRWVGPSLRVMGIFIFAACAISFAWAGVHGIGSEVATVGLILTPLIIGSALYELTRAGFQLEERYTHVALWHIAPNAGRFLIAIAVALTGSSILHVAGGYALWTVFLIVCAALVIARVYRRGLAIVGHGEKTDNFPQTVPTSKEVLQQAWPFAASGIFYLIYFQSDIVLLGWMVGTQAAAIYSVAFAVMSGVFLLPGIVYQKYLIPKLHRWAEHDHNRLREIYKLGNRVMAATGLAVMLALWASALWLIPLIFGEAYVDSGKLVMVLALGVPVRYVAASIGGVLVTQGNMARKVRYQALAAAFNIALNLCLIPFFSFYGAAAATVATDVLLLLVYHRAVGRYVFAAHAPKR
jgi:O-antigen/teichoic acid export membrane protein